MPQQSISIWLLVIWLLEIDGNFLQFNMGGEVPQSYYVINCKPTPKEGMQLLDVGSRSKKKLELQIDASPSVLRWQFMTEGGDIGFRIRLTNETNQEDVEMVPLSRIESHLVMEEGEITCDVPGKCINNDFQIIDFNLLTIFDFVDIVEFENSFSFFRTKRVYYQITVE